MRRLLEGGADVNRAAKNGLTPLYAAQNWAPPASKAAVEGLLRQAGAQ